MEVGMAVVMVQDASAASLAQYDQVVKELEAAGQGNPLGRLSHVCARKEGGYLVVDVWESQEAFDRFAQTLVPLLERAGGAMGQPNFYPLHNAIKGR